MESAQHKNYIIIITIIIILPLVRSLQSAVCVLHWPNETVTYSRVLCNVTSWNSQSGAGDPAIDS